MDPSGGYYFLTTEFILRIPGIYHSCRSIERKRERGREGGREGGRRGEERELLFPHIHVYKNERENSLSLTTRLVTPKIISHTMTPLPTQSGASDNHTFLCHAHLSATPTFLRSGVLSDEEGEFVGREGHGGDVAVKAGLEPVCREVSQSRRATEEEEGEGGET